MSSIRNFFRHCPQCGRRFEVRLVSKKKVEEDSTGYIGKEKAVPEPDTLRAGIETRAMGSGFATGLVHTVVPPAMDVPVIADVEDFEYAYECGHCGHKWAEVREKETMAKEPKGYTGD